MLTPEPDDAEVIAAIDAATSCVVVQYPDVLGRIPDLAADRRRPRMPTARCSWRW